MQGQGSGTSWRHVPGWEEIYAVSKCGKVKRLAGSPYCHQERELKPIKASSGYVYVNLTRPAGFLQRIYIHRLVALVFIGDPPSDAHEVNHVNGNKTDNRVENLEWVTRSRNIAHAYETGLNKQKVGADSHLAKLSADQVDTVFELYAKGIRPKDIAKQIGVSRGTINALLAGRTHSNTKRPATSKTLKWSRTLDRDKVIGIKKMLQDGKMSARVIGEHFGVSGSAVQHIKTGRIWHDVIH